MTRTRSPLLAAALLALASIAQAGELTIGYNQAWIDGSYGHDLTDRFDADAWERILRRTREGGGSALRVWILEGRDKEGVVWDGHRPVGVQPELLANLRALIGLAERHRVQLYWTLLSANWPAHWPKGTIASERQHNVFNDKYGHGALFRERVLGPILQVLTEKPQVNYGLDLMNEVQGSVRAHFWPDGWAGARAFLRAMTAYVHAHAPGLKVTASSGHHTAAWDLLRGRFDGLGLDFYDVHVYEDAGRIPWGRLLAWHARRRGLPIVVGEFGQQDAADDPALQARVTRSLLRRARQLGFSAAFAWRLEDRQAHDLRFSFYEGDRARPALNAMRAAAGLPPIDLAAPPSSRGLTGAVRGSP